MKIMAYLSFDEMLFIQGEISFLSWLAGRFLIMNGCWVLCSDFCASVWFLFISQ